MEIWELLTSAARNHKIYTYGEVAGILNGNLKATDIGELLDPIMKLCQKEDYPHLTDLVVCKEKKIPRNKLKIACNEIDSMRKKVFEYD